MLVKQLAIVACCIGITQSCFAQRKPYAALEAGWSIGGPGKEIKEALISSGFKDNKPGFFSSQDYPVKKVVPVDVLLRFGVQFNKNKAIEIGAGMIHNSKVTGFQQNPQQTGLFGTSGNTMSIKTTILVLSGSYLFPINSNTRIGVGPALVLHLFSISGDKVLSDQTKGQPGITVSYDGRYMVSKNSYIGVRPEIRAYAPATIEAVSMSTDGGFTSEFKTTKVGGFNATLNLGVGFILW
jgi:hypothetical protein